MKLLLTVPAAVLEAYFVSYGFSPRMSWLYLKAWWGCL